jgi:hypothetical protein
MSLCLAAFDQLKPKNEKEMAQIFVQHMIKYD